MRCHIPRMLLAGTLAAIALASCGDNGGTTGPTPTPAAEWPAYVDPEGLFSIRYPPDWTEIRGSFYSYDPSETDQPGKEGLPPNAVMVEVGYSLAQGSSACGPIRLDSSTGEADSPDPEAVETTLDGEQAWRMDRVSSVDDSTHITTVAAVYGGSCVNVSWYDTHETPDEATFQRVVDSFEYGAFVVPAEWPVYTTPDGRLSISYRPDWFTGDEVIYSRDPANNDAANGTRVELSAREAAGLGNCGRALMLENDGGLESIDPAAVEVTVAGEAAWTITDGTPGERLYVEETSLVHNGFCVWLAGYFPNGAPGAWTFAQMYRSLQINL